MGMGNDGPRPRGDTDGGRSGGIFSKRAFSSYLRIASSGASTVAATVRSAGASVASSIADHIDEAARDQVLWAGFDNLECEGNALRKVLLLGYKTGFQIWDVEDGGDVRMLASSYDRPVTFLQVQKNPLALNKAKDKFPDARPLLVIASDGTSCRNDNYDNVLLGGSDNGNGFTCQDQENENLPPTSIGFYSLKMQDYVHVIKFRSAVFSIRCSPRIVAVSQAIQIHCFDAATLEKEYTILTHPVVSGGLNNCGIGYGPLAVGPRWLAYSGCPIAALGSSRVCPQDVAHHVGAAASFRQGSLVAHYAKESSKQLASGIVTLGDMGYKKLSNYYSDFLPDGYNSLKQGNYIPKANDCTDGHVTEMENIGMVVVRDIVSKSVVVQFKAHRTHISALSFDPSGTLLVTASVNGQNINVFCIIPCLNSSATGSDAAGASIHLYRLQRGVTNAVIQDISFSDDSQWIMISSSRGTSHLFALSQFGRSMHVITHDFCSRNNCVAPDQTLKTTARCPHSAGQSKLVQENLLSSGTPAKLYAISRIRNGSNGWKGAVSGAAAAAVGRANPLSGAIASVFHNCRASNLYPDNIPFRKKYHVLIFSPAGCIIQYVLRLPTGEDSVIDLSGLNSATHAMPPAADTKFVVEALQKWDVRRSRRDRTECVDGYVEHGQGENAKFLQKGIRKGNIVYPTISDAEINVKRGSDESHHLYISEAELQMHSPKVPLFAKPKYSFQIMMDANTKDDSDIVFGGETKIERIPIRIVEVRSRDLIPVFDYHHSPRFQQSRASTHDSFYKGQLHQGRSGVFDDGRSSCNSLDCISGNHTLYSSASGIAESASFGSQPLKEDAEDFVHSDSTSLQSKIESVHIEETLKIGAQLGCVNNKECLKMENGFEGNDNDID